MCRLRQIIEAIRWRKHIEARERLMVVEWQTKILASFIAATVEVPKGQKNPLLEAAKDIRLVPRSTDTDESSAVSADDDLSYIESVEGAPAQNSPGSLEALMQGLRLT